MAAVSEDVDHWSRVADEWTAWARTPGHDAFWAYRDGLTAFIGKGDGTALEVGCGEGRVSRLLTCQGYRVTASEPVAALLRAAEEADSADEYVAAPVQDLPFGDDGFDLVMAYNMLMDVQDVPAALKEIARVLKPSGRLLVSIVHPFSDRGRFVGEGADAPFVISDGYFGRERFEGVEERAGLRMSFAGWSQPLELYVSAFEQAGLAITSLREPVPDPGKGAGHLERWNRIPLFLWLEARLLAR